MVRSVCAPAERDLSLNALMRPTISPLSRQQSPSLPVWNKGAGSNAWSKNMRTCAWHYSGSRSTTRSRQACSLVEHCGGSGGHVAISTRDASFWNDCWEVLKASQYPYGRKRSTWQAPLLVTRATLNEQRNCAER